MTNFFWGFFNIMLGAWFVYMGCLMVVGSILPDDLAQKVAFEHGKFIGNKIRGTK